MAAYKDKRGKWYISVYYDTWEGKRSRKVKRGFSTKREALAWERSFLTQTSGNLDITFGKPETFAVSGFSLYWLALALQQPPALPGRVIKII